MSHTLHIGADVVGRGAQIFGAIDAGIRIAAARREEQRVTDIEAVEDLGIALVRTRRALAAARSENVAARQESAVLARELTAANARADRAAADLAKLLKALGARA